MTGESENRQKIRADHLRRDAYLYVRQSTLQQVFNNTESTQRQYGLRQRAVALGWPNERVHVIDSDLGLSGASAVDRAGFQKLVAEVGMGHAGIVLGLEVSRLARNSSDWHRLLEICALSDTLILDEDGLYDPSHFNDRLLLGLKGTMSEAELHVLRARLVGGLRNKARRGELRLALPIGLVYDATERVVLDPDAQVQGTLKLFFQEYQRTGSASAVLRHFHKNHLDFPRRLRGREQAGRLVWNPLIHSRVLQTLHNPRYAGAFVFGRTAVRRCANGRVGPVSQPQEKWQVVLPDVHAGYITWQQYQDNQRTLRANAHGYGEDRRKSPPQQGPALLQGIVVCGVCGRRMTIGYHNRFSGLVADYVCQQERIEHDGMRCQSIPGREIDRAIGALLIEMIRPDTIEMSFAVQREIQERHSEIERIHRQQIERAQYESDLARERFMRVDPNNRLVADALEADWNAKLRLLHEAQETTEAQRNQDMATIAAETRDRVMKLTDDLPALWNDPRVCDQDRKRIVRLLIEDVTLTKTTDVRVQVRFKAGATRTLTIPLPMNAWQLRQTSAEAIALIDRLLECNTDSGTADEINRLGHFSGTKQPFTPRIIARLRRDHQLASTYDRLRRRGLFSLEEVSQRLGVSTITVKTWNVHGLLVGHPYNDKNECLFEMPADSAIPRKQQGRKLSERTHAAKVLFHPPDEVHRAT